MRESTAWKILAEEHDLRNTKSEYLCNSLRFSQIRVFRNERVSTIPRTMRLRMVDRIDNALDHVGATAYGVAGDESYVSGKELQERREARVLACLMFAQQARDEELAAGGWRRGTARAAYLRGRGPY